MTTTTLVVSIILLAILLWVVPMKPFLERLVYAIALICVLLWILRLFGIATIMGLR